MTDRQYYEGELKMIRKKICDAEENLVNLRARERDLEAELFKNKDYQKDFCTTGPKKRG